VAKVGGEKDITYKEEMRRGRIWGRRIHRIRTREDIEKKIKFHQGPVGCGHMQKRVVLGVHSTPWGGKKFQKTGRDQQTLPVQVKKWAATKEDEKGGGGQNGQRSKNTMENERKGKTTTPPCKRNGGKDGSAGMIGPWEGEGKKKGGKKRPTKRKG